MDTGIQPEDFDSFEPSNTFLSGQSRLEFQEFYFTYGGGFIDILHKSRFFLEDRLQGKRYLQFQSETLRFLLSYPRNP